MRQTFSKRVNEGISAFRIPHSASAPRSNARPRAGFTLVELLVVIAIIAILAGLLLVGVQAATGAASEAQIVAEMTQLNNAFEDYKNQRTSYPPNTQIDGTGNANPIDEASVRRTFIRHFKKAFPSHREPPELLAAIVGQGGSGTGENLEGGMNAAEAIVFWLGGFSDDPKYPISGPGGPSYVGGLNDFNADPIENRSWLLDVNVQNLGPRNQDNFFDQTDQRYLVYDDPRNSDQTRRINFWYLKGKGSPAPYVYFDASRSTSAEADNDPPAVATSSNFTQFVGADADSLNQLGTVYAVKSRKEDATDQKPFQFANVGKFQILHCGTDEDWGVFPRVSLNAPDELVDNLGNPLLLIHPAGPWTLELADTLTTFADGTLEDAQP